METEYYFVIFIYKCFNNHPKIFLLNEKGNFTPVLLKDIKSRDFEKAKELFTKATDIKKEDCFPSRFFEYSHSFSFQKEQSKYVVSTSSVRLLDKYKKEKNDFLKQGKWFSKEETFRELEKDKLFRRAFFREFSQNSFWECLDTMKVKNKKNS